MRSEAVGKGGFVDVEWEEKEVILNDWLQIWVWPKARGLAWASSFSVANVFAVVVRCRLFGSMAIIIRKKRASERKNERTMEENGECASASLAPLSSYALHSSLCYAACCSNLAGSLCMQCICELASWWRNWNFVTKLAFNAYCVSFINFTNCHSHHNVTPSHRYCDIALGFSKTARATHTWMRRCIRWREWDVRCS